MPMNISSIRIYILGSLLISKDRSRWMVVHQQSRSPVAYKIAFHHHWLLPFSTTTESISDSTFTGIIPTYFNFDSVSGQQPYEILSYLSRNVSQYHLCVVQFDPKHAIGEWLGNATFMSPFLFLRETLNAHSTSWIGEIVLLLRLLLCFNQKSLGMSH